MIKFLIICVLYTSISTALMFASKSRWLKVGAFFIGSLLLFSFLDVISSMKGSVFNYEAFSKLVVAPAYYVTMFLAMTACAFVFSIIINRFMHR